MYSWLFDLFERPLTNTWEERNDIGSSSEKLLGSLRTKQSLIAENDQLRSDITRLEIDNLRTRYLSEELEKFSSFDNSDTILTAHVVEQGPFGNSDTFIIDRGSRDGITALDIVITHDYLSIGEVEEVYDTTSLVTLYSRPDYITGGILFPHELTVTAYGHGKGSLRIDVSREIDVQVGDLLYSLGEPGNLIAVVRDVVFDPRDPSKQVYLSYPVNLNQIQVVGVQNSKKSELLR